MRIYFTYLKFVIIGNIQHIILYRNPSDTASYLACIRYLFDLYTQNVNKHEISVAEFI